MHQPVKNGIRFSSLFNARDVLCDALHDHPDIIIRSLVESVVANYGLDEDPVQLAKAIQSREQESPTILSPGIVLPHIRIGSVTGLKVAIATSRTGVPYYGTEENLAHLIILVLAPKSDPTAYLQSVSSLTKICNNPDTVAQVTRLETAEEVWKFFDRGGLVLPDYVCAGDIMDPVKVTLKENDTLERAIDLFVQHNLIDLPVVDKDGDLVGVVTAYELLRICLPDYILWMDDVTPIINFEPFARILRNESNTWLVEIMSAEYATVPVEAPAIQVAKEIVKQNTRQAFVLRGSALAGVVTLQGLLNKVLRE